MLESSHIGFNIYMPLNLVSNVSIGNITPFVCHSTLLGPPEYPDEPPVIDPQCAIFACESIQGPAIQPNQQVRFVIDYFKGSY